MARIKGGYYIIDLHDKLLKLNDTEGVTIDGIYKQCEEALKYRKPILLTNINLLSDDDSVSLINDLFVSLEVENNGAFCLALQFYQEKCQINVSNNDKITLDSY